MGLNIISMKRFPGADFSPGATSDGLQCINGIYSVSDCIVDTSRFDLDEFDETISVTWGGSGTFSHCKFTGGGKLCLIGSGDENPPYVEKNKTVYFDYCLFDNFGRRGPEVQSGMTVYLKNCVIRNWGHPDRFITRAFGAWAHHGGTINAENCVFIPYSGAISLRLRTIDKANWVGQSFNYNGIGAIFKKLSWKSGWDRALWASDGGTVNIRGCYFKDNAWHSGENVNGMGEETANKMVYDIDNYFNELEKKI